MPAKPLESRTFTARWVLPVSGPPLANGTVTIRGERIESVDSRGVRAPDEDLGNVAIIPGLVNAHTHLDLSGARGIVPPTDPDHFTDWLRGVIAYRRSRTPEQVQVDIRAGLAEAMRFGTTLLGDIAAEGASWDVVSQSEVRSVVFKEWIGFSEGLFRSIKLDVMKWLGRETVSNRCRPGVSPHAPYSVAEWAARLLTGSAPAAVHWAESPAEMELIASHSGPFVPFLEELGIWKDAQHNLALSHRQLSAQLGRKSTVRSPLLLAHANYQPAEAIWRSGTSVVYCPRTHAAFRHPPHSFRDFLARGVRVCLGTDSLASNPDLDVLAEARFVHAKYPDFPGETLLCMATLSASEALGWADETGSLEPGKSADFVVVPLPDRDASDPHEILLTNHPGERRTMFQGEWRE